MVNISHKSILEQGRYKGISLEGVEPGLAIRLYRFMVRLRACQEALVSEYHPADEMRCPVHFCIGQEAVPAALALVVNEKDYLFSHHRSHGYYFAKGAPMNALFAELYGKDSGANGGLAGSQDISYSAKKFYSGAILSGATAMSVGTGLALQLKQDEGISIAGFGEAAADEGIFWESISYAALQNLPVVFICENNLYATYSHQMKRHPLDNISERVQTFGVESKAMFGNDAVKNYEEISRAVLKARQGRGPSFIEFYTYRWNGHVGPEDDDKYEYRPKEEVEFWRDNCPIQLLEEVMVQRGLIDGMFKEALMTDINLEIKAAFEFAKSSDFPVIDSWESLNNANETPDADRLLLDIRVGDFNENQDEAIPGPY